MWMKIPADVPAIDQSTGKPSMAPSDEIRDGMPVMKPEILSFQWWLNRYVLNDPRWGVDPKAFKHYDAVEKAFKDKKAGDSVFIERADYDFLKDVVETPKYRVVDPRSNSIGHASGYDNPLVFRTTRSFVRAVQNAVEDEKDLNPPQPA